MSDRVNIKTDEATRDRLSGLKRDGETWDGLLKRAADALDTDQRGRPPGVCSACGTALDAWTVVDGDALCLECAGIDPNDA
jgi:hypothetical protein